MTYVRKDLLVLVKPSGVTLQLGTFTFNRWECVFCEDSFQKLQQQNPDVEFVDRTSE